MWKQQCDYVSNKMQKKPTAILSLHPLCNHLIFASRPIAIILNNIYFVFKKVHQNNKKYKNKCDKLVSKDVLLLIDCNSSHEDRIQKIVKNSVFDNFPHFIDLTSFLVSFFS